VSLDPNVRYDHLLFGEIPAMNKPFWIVWNPDAPMPPQVRFHAFSRATRAAEALARKIPGQTFHVLKLAGSVVKNELTWTFPEEDDDHVEPL
jgi:hypothetical protein